MEDGNSGTAQAQVVELDERRRASRRRLVQPGSEHRTTDELLAAIDLATKNVHAVASVSLRMVHLVRSDLGLPDLRK